MSRAALILLVVSVLVASPQVDGQALWGPGENGIVFSEVHYHPPGDIADEEFVEIVNRGVRWVDVSEWKITGAIEFTFPDDVVLAPGDHVAIARRAEALRSRARTARILGDFKGRLSNSNEILVLENRTGRTIATLHYRDGRGFRGGVWPRGADGRGASLELIAPSSEWEHPWRWDASRVVGGTPGAANSVAESRVVVKPSTRRGRRRAAVAKKPPPRPRLRINEVGLGPGGPFVELAAGGKAAVRLVGGTLRNVHRVDAKKTGAKSVEVSASLAAGRVMRVEAAEIAELLTPLGGEKPSRRLFLFGPAGELLDAIEIPRLVSGTSFGRIPDGGSNLLILPKPTPGKANEAPLSATIVINEIYYNGASGDGSDEFIELHNPGKKAVGLDGWELDDAIRFRFTKAFQIAPGGYLVVARDPEYLRRRGATLPRGATVAGPFKGKLSNKTERIVLRDRWGATVDEVRYADRPPWPAAADGKGSSLELRNPGIDNRWGDSWARSGPSGSPGTRNRNLQKLIPPMVVGVSHEPAAPIPGEMVTVHAHVISSRRVTSVQLVYHEVSIGSRPVSKRMFDKGTLDDGVANDGHFAVRFKMPTRAPEGGVLGYRFVVKPSSGRAVTIPDGSREFLMPVETPDKRTDGLPNYHVVMMPRDAERFAAQKNSADDWYSCTFTASVSGSGVVDGSGVVRHGCFVRLRGNNSRRPPDGRMSYRLRLAGGEYFDGRDRFILNAFASFRQKAGGDFMKFAGLPTPRLTTVRLSIPGRDDSGYLDVEVVDENFLFDKFGSDDGELFRGKRGKPFGADFSFRGRENVEQHLAAYQRVNKKESQDLTRLFDLLEALDIEDDAEYFDKVSALVDVPEWATYFAANNLLGNTEGGLSVSDADDFFVASRASDKKWVLIPWDHDSTFADPRQPLFRPTLKAIRRFVRHPRIAPLYHLRVRELADGPLSGASFVLQGVEMSSTFLPLDIERLARFMRRRQRSVRENYVLWPHAALRSPRASSEDESPSASRGPLVTGGFGGRLFASRSTESIRLQGFADPAIAFSVSVDGKRASYDPVRGEWKTTLPLEDGANEIWVSFHDASGIPVSTRCINIEAGRVPRRVPSSLSGKNVWTAEKGPYYLDGVVTVGGGATLRIGPGVEVICGPDALLVVKGRIEIAGERSDPVSFRTESWRQPWKGIRVIQAGVVSRPKEHRIVYCRFEGGRGQEIATRESSSGAAKKEGDKKPESFLPVPPMPFLRSIGAKVTLEGCVFRGILGHAVGVEKGSIELRDVVIADSRHGVIAVDGKVLIERCRFHSLSGDGIDLRRGRRREARIVATVLRDVQGAGIRVAASSATVDGVTISGAGVGIDVRENSKLVATGSTIVESGVAVLVDREPWGSLPASAIRPSKRSDVSVKSSILVANGRAVLASSTSKVSVEGCRLERPKQLTRTVKTRDLNTAPVIFRSPLRGDFREAGDARRP
jgi:hypothetical protein